MHPDPILIPIVAIIGGVCMGIFIPLVRAYARRMERGDLPSPSLGGSTSGDILNRLERMEQSIDSIAIEVERIAEGQRFTTKLLSERAESSEAGQRPPTEQRA